MIPFVGSSATVGRNVVKYGDDLVGAAQKGYNGIIEIDVSCLNVVKGRDGVHYCPNDDSVIDILGP